MRFCFKKSKVDKSGWNPCPACGTLYPPGIGSCNLHKGAAYGLGKTPKLPPPKSI